MSKAVAQIAPLNLSGVTDVEPSEFDLFAAAAPQQAAVDYATTPTADAGTYLGNGDGALLSGGGGDDTFVGAEVYRHTIDGGIGVDTLDLSSASSDYATSGDFCLDIDRGLSLNGGMSFIHGSYSNLENIISFTRVSIEIIGNAANNVIQSSLYDDTIRGEAGNDVLKGLDGADLLFGGDDSDTLIGGAGMDTLYGGAGDDMLLMLDGTGPDNFHGENGIDTADFTAITGYDMVFNTAIQTYAMQAGGQSFAFNSIEILLTGAGDDVLAGSNAYTMTINGGAGTDTLDLSDSYFNISTFGNFTLDIDEAFIVNGSTRYGAYSNMENVVSFDRVAIELIGNAANNELTASVYNDALYGEGGADKLFGREGNDSLFGGNGADDIYGGDGDDLLRGQNGEDSLYGGLGDDELIGGDGNDFIDGSDGDDSIIGGNGLDEIYGGIGADNLKGGFRNDAIYGGDQSDVIGGGDGSDEIYGDTGSDVINGNKGNDTIYGGAGNDDLTGAKGNDTMFGGTGSDTLDGQNGRDIMDGGAGEDTLIGGNGNDTLTGGTGADIFVFYVRDDDDVITDFEVGIDTIRLTGLTSADVSFSNAGGGDTLVTLTNGDTILVQNTSITDLNTFSDFEFG